MFIYVKMLHRNEGYKMTLTQRFLKYVAMDTQSDENSSTIPSTKKQLVLANELLNELKQMNIHNSYIDEYGIVYAFIDANNHSNKKIGLIAHMDTSPDMSGKNVKPQLIKNYDGSSIVLNKKLIANVDENKKDVIMYFEKKEDLGEIDIWPEAEDMKIYSDDYTNKKYRSRLDWDYTEKRAEHLINYIKKHLEKTKEIELWEIWLGEEEKPNIEYCKLCELDNKKIKKIFGHGFKQPMCLKVVKE